VNVSCGLVWFGFVGSQQLLVWPFDSCFPQKQKSVALKGEILRNNQ